MNSSVVPIRRVFRIVNGGTPSASPENWDGDIAWATPADLAKCDGARILSTQRNLTPVGLESGSNLVAGGGLIVSSRAPIGYVVETVKSTAINQGCKGLVPKQDIDIRFFRYQLSAMTARLRSLGQGSTFLEVSSEALASCPIRAPSLSEQRETADSLDVATAQIDSLIAKKHRLVELLQLRIDSTVFAGIRGKLTSQYAIRIPSGIGWLGEIPEHYSLPWIGAYYSTQLGKMLNGQAATGPEQYRYIKNANVLWDELVLDELPMMTFDAHDRKRCELRNGDLLVCEGGEAGRSAIWQHGSGIYFQKAIHRVRPRTQGVNRFLMYCLWAAAKQGVFAVEGNQSTIVHLTGEKLRAHRVPWPPIDEQEEIVSLIDAERQKADSAIAVLAKQIELLHRRRRTLIEAATCGSPVVAESA